jgi:FixJ family two-component response regulator
MQSEPTIFIVDEDAATCSAVHALGAMMNLRCEVFDSGQTFLERFDRSRCGCLVTELKLRGVSGLQLQQRLLADGVTLPVIFLSAHGTLPIAVRAMRAGAYHFLEKPIHEPELWDAIQGAILLDQENRDAARQDAALRERLGELTLKEEQVLRMIAEGKANRAIARELDVSMRTVEIRRNALMKKLGLKTSDELLRFALAACNGHSRKPSSNVIPTAR